MGQVDTKFNEIDIAPVVDAFSYFVGVHDNGDGTYNDYRFTTAQLAGYFSGTSPVITAGSGGYTIGGAGTTLTGSFFATTISRIFTNQSAYIVGVDFSQSGTTITWLINGQIFQAGQKLIAGI